jgi:hypothetical protein
MTGLCIALSTALLQCGACLSGMQTCMSAVAVGEAGFDLLTGW